MPTTVRAEAAVALHAGGLSTMACIGEIQPHTCDAGAQGNDSSGGDTSVYAGAEQLRQGPLVGARLEKTFKGFGLYRGEIEGYVLSATGAQPKVSVLWHDGTRSKLMVTEAQELVERVIEQEHVDMNGVLRCSTSRNLSSSLCRSRYFGVRYWNTAECPVLTNFF